jgi:hypothetical protein
VEDYWDVIEGTSWKWCIGNSACTLYAKRSAAANLPLDDEVLYGKIGIAGCLVHVSELVDAAGGNEKGD